ncbi:Importin subunit alpha-7 [Amphibalanus amphitrite]|uniref:Importin subunit alpha n=2 Tax=Amphibalanus amphitrite TaxID=1232801 RepID=A0A6A4WGB8_AMPAM|nr:Importin subunit alpha-7 [Amphibalanus amphitrite]
MFNIYHSQHPVTMSSHRHRYKNEGLDSAELRRRREEEGVQLRKQKRDRQLNKRRNVPPLQPAAPDEPAPAVAHAQQESQCVTPELVAALYSPDPERLVEAAHRCRKLLSREPNPPIDEVIRAGVVPRFVQLLQADHQRLQFEAAWALTNVASGSSAQTRCVVDAGAVPVLISLLQSPHDEVRDQAVWALGNVAGDSPECRDHLLDQGLLGPLTEILSGPTLRLSLKRNAVWTLSNLCRGKSPPPDFSKVSPCLPLLARLLTDPDGEVLADACWALGYLSDGPNYKIQAVLDAGVCPRLAELLLHGEQRVVSAALRAVGNIATGDDMQTQVILGCQALPCLRHLLTSQKESIKKESCWTISNITAGNQAQIQAVIDADIIPALVEVIWTAEFRTRKEAVWAITNATTAGTPEQTRYLVEQRCIPALCEMLGVLDPKITQVALNGLENILRVGELDARESGQNQYALLVEECCGLDKIEALQTSTNQEVYQKAYDLIDTYFSADGDASGAAEPERATDGEYRMAAAPADRPIQF